LIPPTSKKSVAPVSFFPAKLNSNARPKLSESHTRNTSVEQSITPSSRQRRTRYLALFLVVLLVIVAAGLVLAAPGESGATTNGTETSHGAPFDAGKMIWEVVFVGVLIIINAFFVIAEYSLIQIRKTRVQQLVEEGNRSAILVDRLLKNPTSSTRMMATIQTGVTLIATLSSALAATSTVEPLANWLRHHASFLAARADSIALVLVTLPVAVLTLVCGEIAPKSLAARNTERFALIAARPITLMQTLLAPVVIVLTVLSNIVVKALGGDSAKFTTSGYNEEELKIIVEASEEQGVLVAEETEMIHSILDFRETVTRRVMTPRIDMTAFDIADGMPGLIRLIKESGHSRIPVYEDDLDNILGIVHAKDILDLPGNASRDIVPIQEVMRPAYFIPETKRVGELLTEFRHKHQQLAIVRNEYGTVAGLVTLEDLIEEIVGEIQDEYDDESPLVHVLSSTTSILDGKMNLNDVNDRMALNLPEDEADTIGGFVFSLIGHQAEQGERARWNDIDFVVEASDGRRITKVRIIRNAASHDGKAEGKDLKEDSKPDGKQDGSKSASNDGDHNGAGETIPVKLPLTG